MFFSFLDYDKEFSALHTILFKKPHYEYFSISYFYLILYFNVVYLQLPTIQDTIN